MVELAHLRTERDALLAKQAMRVCPLHHLKVRADSDQARADSDSSCGPSCQPSPSQIRHRARCRVRSESRPQAQRRLASIATEPAEAVIPREPPQERQTANRLQSAPSEVPVPEKPTPPPTERTAPSSPAEKDPPLPFSRIHEGGAAATAVWASQIVGATEKEAQEKVAMTQRRAHEWSTDW